MRHLYANVCHDEAEVWCEKPDYIHDGEPTRRPDDATCLACLMAAGTFGRIAAMRYLDLVNKQ